MDHNDDDDGDDNGDDDGDDWRDNDVDSYDDDCTLIINYSTDLISILGCHYHCIIR